MGIVELRPNGEANTKPDENCCTVEENRNTEAPLLSPSSSPVTPDSSRESINLPLADSFDETPKDGAFDSFSMDPETLVGAPYCNKCTRKSSVHAVRRSLSYEIGNDGACDNELSSAFEEEQLLFELLYTAILDFVVLPELAISDSDVNRTPDFVPRVNWVAETCPRAPLKVMNRRRHIDRDICRKLEF